MPRESPGTGVVARTAGPGSLEMLSRRLLTERPCLRVGRSFMEQVTYPGFSESQGQGSS